MTDMSYTDSPYRGICFFQPTAKTSEKGCKTCCTGSREVYPANWNLADSAGTTDRIGGRTCSKIFFLGWAPTGLSEGIGRGSLLGENDVLEGGPSWQLCCQGNVRSKASKLYLTLGRGTRAQKPKASGGGDAQQPLGGIR